MFEIRHALLAGAHSHSHPTHTHDKIRRALKPFRERFEVPPKVTPFITDHGSNMVKALDDDDDEYRRPPPFSQLSVS